MVFLEDIKYAYTSILFYHIRAFCSLAASQVSHSLLAPFTFLAMKRTFFSLRSFYFTGVHYVFLVRIFTSPSYFSFSPFGSLTLTRQNFFCKTTNELKQRSSLTQSTMLMFITFFGSQISSYGMKCTSTVTWWTQALHMCTQAINHFWAKWCIFE